MIRISEDMFEPDGELGRFNRRADGAGAVVSFLGNVRARVGDAEVQGLELEHYPGVTERAITTIASEVIERWRLCDVEIIHRVGRLLPGDPIVFVATAADHRREAFEAADYLMDYLKTKALFWKKEIRDNGVTWIEPRDADYKDAARWQAAQKNTQKD